MLGRHLLAQIVEHRGGGGQREGQFLLRRRAGLLQMVGTHVHRVPFRQVLAGIGGDVGDHPQRRFRRADIGAAREVFLDEVVLHRALELGDIRALFLGHRDIEREQPGGGRVDRHRGVHLLERDLRRTASACRPDAPPARRPCRLRRAPACGRCRSRSGSAGRRRSRGRSAPWRGWCGRARSTPWRWSDRRRCGTATADRLGDRPSLGAVSGRGLGGHRRTRSHVAVQHFCRKQQNYSSPIFGGISLRDPVPPQTVGTVRVSITAVASSGGDGEDPERRGQHGNLQ